MEMFMMIGIFGKFQSKYTLFYTVKGTALYEKIREILEQTQTDYKSKI